MSAFDSIKAGLEDAISHAKGKKTGVTHVVEIPDVDVKAAREKLGLSQDRFARAFGISASTLRKWEQGQRRPEGPARVLLTVIDREPEAVLRAISGKS